MQAAKLIGTKVLRPRQQVEDQIRAAILSGALRSGDRLPGELELAQQFGVSRTTVREALRSLVTRGLIEKTPGAGGGSFVRSADPSALRSALAESMHTLLTLGSIELDEVCVVRQHLEELAVRLAAAHRTEDDLSELRRLLDAQESTSVEDPGLASMEEQFHRTVARASGNRILSPLVSALPVRDEPLAQSETSPEAGRTAVRQHRRIVQAIEDGDPDSAADALTEHVTYLRDNGLACPGGR